MLISAFVNNDRQMHQLQQWNQFVVLCQAQKFPSQGFSNATFDQWLHKATFWHRVSRSQILKSHSHSFIDPCKYFVHVLLSGNAIIEIPQLFKVWCDPKFESIMYNEDLLRDWLFTQLKTCGWYVDCPLDSTFTYKRYYQKKN